jgi:hypothetical protein
MPKINLDRSKSIQFVKNTFQIAGKEKIFTAIARLPKGHSFKLKMFWENPSSLDNSSLQDIYSRYVSEGEYYTCGNFSKIKHLTQKVNHYSSSFLKDAMRVETDPILKLILMRELAKNERDRANHAKDNIVLKKYKCTVYVQVSPINPEQLMVREIFPIGFSHIGFQPDGRFLFGEKTHTAIRCFNGIKKLARRAGFRAPIVAYENGNLREIRKNIEETTSRYIIFGDF